jgi:hypothetical protein
LITGASAGIGAALARRMAADGWHLALSARRLDRLQALAAELQQAFAIQTLTIPADLSDPAGPAAIFTATQAAGLALTALVNNAGAGYRGNFHQADLPGQLDLLRLNVEAVTALTGLYLPGMVARRSGYILNLASTAAFQPGPGMAVYYAAKAYVLHFSEALALELAGTGVKVTALCPGPTMTEFQAAAGVTASRMVAWLGRDNLSQVVEAGYQAMLRGKPVVIPGFINAFLAWGNRFMPRRWSALVAKRLHD